MSSTSGSPNRRRRFLVWLFGALALALGVFVAPTPARAQSGGSLAQIQAAYVLNFVLFTTWPEQKPGVAPAERIIGVVGDDFGAVALEEAVARRAAEAKAKNTEAAPKITIRRVRQSDDLEGCHVLLVGEGYDEDKWNAVLNGLREKPVLTIGAGRAFAQRRGLVGLYLAEDRLRFAVNLSRAEASGLRISSRLLGLADVIRE